MPITKKNNALCGGLLDVPPKQPFSRRHGYRLPAAEITIREDAPEGLRHAVISLAEDGMTSKRLVNIVRRSLGLPMSQDWTPSVQLQDAVDLIENCPWFKVYDVAEALYRDLDRNGGAWRAHTLFEQGLNEYFEVHGIGWHMRGGAVEIRGPHVLQETVDRARAELEQANRPTSASEIHKAFGALSQRPHPDITGAIQHAGAGLECVARDVVGNPKATLGEILKQNPDLFPGALAWVAKGVWGFCSEMGRHLKEGRAPTLEEAWLLVGLCASASAYLTRPPVAASE
jgi:hypothetical protein